MKIDFNTLKELTIPNMNGGNGEVVAKMFMNKIGKVMTARLPVLPQRLVSQYR